MKAKWWTVGPLLSATFICKLWRSRAALDGISALESSGIHWNWFPADVNSNPDNPLIDTRSFGEDASLVKRRPQWAVC